MNIIGGINLPKSADASDLYIQCNESASINYQEDDKKVVLRQGGIISSNSYFNSFYRKNLSQMADNAVGVIYHRLHHFLTEAPWSTLEVNKRRLVVMNQCSQTRISRGFTLIVDDSGHRKSGNFTEGVGRQYIGEVGKTDNGIVVVTTHLYDGKKSLPLDIELYQHASCLPEEKKDEA